MSLIYRYLHYGDRSVDRNQGHAICYSHKITPLSNNDIILYRTTRFALKKLSCPALLHTFFLLFTDKEAQVSLYTFEIMNNFTCNVNSMDYHRRT